MYADLNSYLTCAAWSSTDENGEPLDSYYFSNSAREQMEKELNDFVEYCEENHPEVMRQYEEAQDASQFAHDFWLTRNGHGAGFWDRGLGEVGEVLTKAAKTFGSCDLYLSSVEMEICIA